MKPAEFFNRELSWLEFNDGVLREGLSPALPPLERMKFLAIVSGNLDEFFMIRVAALMSQRSAGVRRRDPSGLTPARQLTLIGRRVRRMVDEQTRAVRSVLAEAAAGGLAVPDAGGWSPDQRRFCRAHFAEQVLPVLTPLAVEELDPCPLLPGLRLNVVAAVSPAAGGEEAGRIVVVPVPGGMGRFIPIPGEAKVNLARLEDVIAANLDLLFPGCRVVRAAVFRITRDGDVAIRDEEAGDLLGAVEEAVLERRRRAAVRLEISAGADRRIRRWLVGWLGLRAEDVYRIDGMLDAAALMELAGRRGLEDMKGPDWPPQPPADLIGTDDVWEAVRDHDVMLFHPYESFEPVVKWLAAAAEDPGVLAIKQTLYRTSADSPIIAALGRAAAGGKQVTVLVELKARFDEARNVNWARRLEDLGCHVIYGIAGFKTHAKALLIVRREADRIRRYVHLSTGNYNDRTARLYSDVALLTADPDIAGDVAAFFNLLTGASEVVGWSALAIAPTELRQRFEDLIEREVQTSDPLRPGLIMAKLNSLEDAGICRALYRASAAGVKVMLNVRGICCLRPGVPGLSENIEVRSIIDRYLEHARIFHFRNGGHEEVYLGSADWMRRNLDRRLEFLFPVRDGRLRQRLIAILQTCLADNVKARRLLPDGSYEPVPAGGPSVRAQECFYREAVEAVRLAERSAVRFRPLARPEE